MVLQEVRKIWWVTSVQSFEGQGGKFKLYSPFSRKPVELFEMELCEKQFLCITKQKLCITMHGCDAGDLKLCFA